MNNTTPIKMPSRGYYGLHKVDAYGNSRTEGCPSNIIENVVTYGGAYVSLISEGLFQGLYAELGTSSTERVRSDTSLGASDSGRSSASNSVDRYGNEIDNLDGTSTITLTREMSFSLGDKVGTFSEVGMYTSSSSGTFIAGQLIKDEFGAPTTVTVLSDEQLIITYTLEWTVPNTTKQIGTGTVTDAGGNSYSYEIWAQPYFADYDNAYRKDPRYFYGNNSALTIRGSSGTSPRADVPSSTPWGISTNSTGLVTALSPNKVYSPTDFDQQDMTYIGFGNLAGWAMSSEADIVDTSITLGKSSDNNRIPCYVKFATPIAKTDQQSFSIQIEMKVQV